MKNIIKVISLVVAFVVTGILTFIFTNKQIEVKVTNLSEATLPVVSFMTDNGMNYNRTFGYTCQPDVAKIRDSITVIPKDMQLDFVIDKYNSQVKSIRYEVRSLDESNLYENTTITEYTDSMGKINCTANIKNLIEENVQYLLKIVLTTNNYEEVNYYSRIIYSKDIDVESKLKFAMDFSNNTLSQETLGEVKKYIEPNKSQDNTNFGKIDIHASLAQFGFDELAVEKCENVHVKLNEIEGNNATVVVSYDIEVNDFTNKSSLMVRDSYELTETKSRMYLMDFERTVNQVFDPNNAVMPSSRIYFGIADEFVTEKKCDDKGNNTAFVRNNELWMYKNKAKVLTGIFSFKETEGDNVREANKNHGIKIINVDSTGNMQFAVYGYMNRGSHEGKLGISIYDYNAETSIVNELVFIPSDSGFDVLSKEFGELIYINNNKVIYIFYNNTLYSIEPNGRECVKIAENIKDGNYIISPDQKIFTYLKQNDKYNSTALEIIKLEDFTKYTIEAGMGDRISLLGYVGSDWAYGVAHASDIKKNQDGTTTFPMYRILIVDKDYNPVKVYGFEDVYVSNVEISGKRLILDRVVKDGDIYVPTDGDQLMNRDENKETSKLKDLVVSTQVRKKELYLGLPSEVGSLKELEYNYSNEVVYNDIYEVNVDNVLPGDEYLVYSKSGFLGMYSDISQAINTAYDNYGRVINSKQNVLYNAKEKPSSYSQTRFKGDKVNKEDSLLKCIEMLLKANSMGANVKDELSTGDAINIFDKYLYAKAYNIEGCKVDAILYYVSKDTPVIGKIGPQHYVLITEYTKATVSYYDPVAGAYKTVDIDDYNHETFIIYVKKDEGLWQQ